MIGAIFKRTMSSSSLPLQREIVFLSAVRTPVGSFKGALASLSATDLGAIAVENAVTRSGVAKDKVDQCIMGSVLSAGLGQAPARQAAIKAGLNESTVCTTVNKVCASGMKAVTLASQALQLGHADFVVAGGMESMSNAPFYCTKARQGCGLGHQSLQDAILLDGLTDASFGILMGECGEYSAEKHGVTRVEQDVFAARSYQAALASWTQGVFDKEIVPVVVTKAKNVETVVKMDEECSKIPVETLPSMRTVFKKDGGTITAGNASKINDGASAVLLSTMDLARQHNVMPLAKLVAYADAEGHCRDFPTAPALAIPKALARCGLALQDISLFEINEAFSCVVLANQKILGIPLEKINVAGGAVALGHPIGSSGCRIIVTLINLLKAGEYGCAAICNGGGGATAVIIQKL